MTHQADQFIEEALYALKDRASVRDTNQERSMANAVNSFNAMHGTQLTETQGWQFMIFLKLARANAGKFHADDYIDICGYGALAGECASGDMDVQK